MTEAERERIESRRLWAAMMLAPQRAVCESLMRGLPVRAAQLDVLVLQRGLRGGALPRPDEFVVVGRSVLDAIDEVGALRPRQGRRTP